MSELSVCDQCGERRETSITAIVDGRFGQYCQACLDGMKRGKGAQVAGDERNRDREQYAKDMLQPWLPNGQPNREFIKAYPDKAHDYYSDEELEDV